MKITLRQLQAFVLVAEERSFSRAGARMGLTQSAMSVLLRELERAVGDVRLLERTPRAVTLTGAGLEARARAQLICREADLFAQELRELANLTRGSVKIACSAAVAASILPPLIGKFQLFHPGIMTEIVDVDPNELFEVMRSGAADLAICTAEDNDPDLLLEPLITDHLAMIVPADHPEAGRASIRWSELAGLKTISVRRSSNIRRLIDRSLSGLDQTFAPVLEVSFLTTALSFTAEGLGVAILPPSLVPQAHLGTFVAVPITDPVVSRTMSLVTRRNRPLSAAACALRDLTKTELTARVPT